MIPKLRAGYILKRLNSKNLVLAEQKKKHNHFTERRFVRVNNGSLKLMFVHTMHKINNNYSKDAFCLILKTKP